MPLDRKYVLPSPETITISSEAAEKLIASKNPAAALLYIYILKNNGELSLTEAAEKLGLGEKLDAALNELARLDLISHMPRDIIEREDSPPEYSTDDIERSIKTGSSFGPLVRELQQMMGSVLSGSTLKVFFGIYDYLGLPAEVILLLVAYCMEKNEKRYGGARKPTASFIEKEAYKWVRNDIYTLEAAEAYIKKQSQKSELADDVRNALRIKKRALSPTEEKYIDSWLEMGFMPDAIELAYDRTVVKTGELTWPYMNSILKNWHEKGLHSLPEIQAGDNMKKKKKYGNTSESKPDTEDIDQMKKYLNKLKSEDSKRV